MIICLSSLVEYRRKKYAIKRYHMLIKTDEEFMKMVDELVRLADNDAELFEGIKWIDNESKKLGISFYEMFFLILQRHLADENAKEWLKRRNQ